MTIMKKKQKDSPKNIKRKNEKDLDAANVETKDSISQEDDPSLHRKRKKNKHKHNSFADENQNTSNDCDNYLNDSTSTSPKSKKKRHEHVVDEKVYEDEKDTEKNELIDFDPRSTKIKKKKNKENCRMDKDVILNDDGSQPLDNDDTTQLNDADSVDEVGPMLSSDSSKVKKKKTKVVYEPEDWEPLACSPEKKSKKSKKSKSFTSIPKEISLAKTPNICSEESVAIHQHKEPAKKCSLKAKEMVEEDINEDYIRELANSKNAPKWLRKEKSKLSRSNSKNILEGKPHTYTTSIAIPASILEETCLLLELRTYVVGQLARVACIYSVDEIIVFNDCREGDTRNEEYMGMMKMLLEYQECPQYLRRALFPYHWFMAKVGVLNPLNAPHHLLNNEWCPYREGVVEDSGGPRSTVNVGMHVNVVIDRHLEPNVRVTVKFPPEAKSMAKPYGIVVSPEEPRLKGGLYWGYTVRIADSIAEIFEGDRFPKYDLLIGTSDKGKDINSVEKFTPFSNALIVFGGVQGLEKGFKLDKKLSKKEPSKYFDYYLNMCPNQQSRTIRTEEAVTLTLAKLSHILSLAGKES